VPCATDDLKARAGDPLREHLAVHAGDDAVVVAGDDERRRPDRTEPVERVVVQHGVDMRPVARGVLDVARLLLGEAFEKRGVHVAHSRGGAVALIRLIPGGGLELPDYRIVAAPLQIDGISGNYQVTGQQYPPSALPELAREHISEKVELRDGVGSIEAMAGREEIKLMPPMAADLARVMNSENDNPYQHINSIYWNVSPKAVHGVLDQIRTALTQLVAELRANMAGGEDVPSSEAADQAVQVVVTGKRSNVTVTTAQASGGGSTSISTEEPGPEESEFWTRSRRIGAFVVGLATVVAAVVAIIQLH
jgi:AbiTii